jgi:NAD(P)-dependent dehydrogenase (short-subunit alcohol dehydrogenase family)
VISVVIAPVGGCGVRRRACSLAGATWPLGRFGTAEEAAATALFLMANNYITGQIVTVDGGETMA